MKLEGHFEMNRPIPLLMTASVDTLGMKWACFSPKERYPMYLDAMTFYISVVYGQIEGVKIVFVENSGWDLTSFHDDLSRQFGSEIVDERVEFIALDPQLFDITKGKGYNELLLINHAIERSATIRQAGYFFKVTGRYPIFNAARFLKDAAKSFDKGYNFYCDIKNHNLYQRLGLSWRGHSYEARLWGSKVDFYKENISQHYTQCYDYDERFVEVIIYKELSLMTDSFRNAKAKGISLRFPREPRFGGVEGSAIDAVSFSRNQQSLKSKAKIGVGNFIRIFMPWFKF